MIRRFGCVAAAVVLCGALLWGQAKSAKTLDIYVVDVEGGRIPK